MRFQSVYDSKFFKAQPLFLLGAMLFPTVTTARAEGNAQASDLTSNCTFTLPERSVSFEPRLTDDYYNSRISFDLDETLTVTLPSGAKGLYIGWYTAPEAATIESLDASGTVMQSVSANPDLLNDYYPLPDNCASVRVTSRKEVCHLRGACLRYRDRAGRALRDVRAGTQPKVMVILAHTADDPTTSGAYCHIFPAVTQRLCSSPAKTGRCSSRQSRGRYALGSRTQPIFGEHPSAIELKKLYTYIEKTDVNNWLIQLLRRYQPDTIITHAAISEDSEGMHELTTKARSSSPRIWLRTLPRSMSARRPMAFGKCARSISI